MLAKMTAKRILLFGMLTTFVLVAITLSILLKGAMEKVTDEHEWQVIQWNYSIFENHYNELSNTMKAAADENAFGIAPILTIENELSRKEKLKSFFENQVYENVSTYRYNFCAVTDLTGIFLVSDYYMLSSYDDYTGKVAQFPTELTTKISDAITHSRETNSSNTGVIDDESGNWYLICSKPIKDAIGMKTIGYIATGFKFDYVLMNYKDVNISSTGVYDGEISDENPYYIIKNDDEITGHYVLKDINQKRRFDVAITVPRDLGAENKNLLFSGGFIIALAAFFAMALIGLIQSKSIVKPLHKANLYLAKVLENPIKTIEPPPDLKNADFNKMLQRAYDLFEQIRLDQQAEELINKGLEEQIDTVHLQTDVLLQTENHIYIIDDRGFILYANAAAKANFPVDDDLIGKHMSYVTIVNPLLTESGWEGEFSYKNDKGEFTWELYSVSPVKNKKGSSHTYVIEHFVFLRQDITKLRNAHKELNNLAYHDSTTGLPNKYHFEFNLENQLNENLFTDKKIVVFLLDIKRFNVIIDILGHKAGDECIALVANRLKELFLGNYFLARLGGDKFSIYVIIDNKDEVETLKNRIFSVFDRAFVIGNYKFKVIANMGSVLFPDDAKNVNDLMQNAELALDKAKKEPDNYFYRYERQMYEKIIHYTEIEKILQRALKSKAFIVEYQPIRSLDRNMIVGVEALIRLNEEQNNKIEQADFISCAEESGLIVPMSEFVIDQVLEDFHQHIKKSEEFYISINLSIESLYVPGFIDSLESNFLKSKSFAKNVEFELPEPALVLNDAAIEQVVEKLVKMSGGLTMDRVGTGGTSLPYLIKFKVKRIKIHGSIIKKMMKDEKVIDVVRTKIRIAHSLGIVAIAEGIENQEQLELLKMLGCNEVQGDYISKPMNINDFLEFFKANKKK